MKEERAGVRAKVAQWISSLNGVFLGALPGLVAAARSQMEPSILMVSGGHGDVGVSPLTQCAFCHGR